MIHSRDTADGFGLLLCLRGSSVVPPVVDIVYVGFRGLFAHALAP